MLKRIRLSYMGAFLIIVCLRSPWTMAGHSLMYLTVFGLPIGITAGLFYSDFRQRYLPTATLIRTLAGFLVVMLVVLLVSRIRVSPFWVYHGWVLIPLCAPLVAAITSGLILATRVKPPI